MSPTTTVTVRPATFDDVVAYRRLGVEAFGVPSTPLPEPTPESFPAPGGRPWLALDGDELVARLLVRDHTTWFHGARLRTAGLAGVTVAAEHRGRGLLRPLVEAALDAARADGAVLSTLFPSAAGIYTGLGYAAVSSHDSVRIPLHALAQVPPPGDGTRARRATAADLPGIAAAYDAWAAAHNGPLTRAEVPFTFEAPELFGPDGATAVTLAVEGTGDAERVVGFCTWKRGEGYLRDIPITVDDLIALTPDAARILWRALASFQTVVGAVELATSGGWTGADPSRRVLPDHVATLVSANPYMLRVLDVPGALGAARLAPVSARVPFAVEGRGDTGIAGAWRLEVDEGAVRVAPDDDERIADRLLFTPAGLAASYAGASSCASLRAAGLLGGSDRHDHLWDTLWRGRDVHVRDAF